VGYRLGMFETPITHKQPIRCRGCGRGGLYWHNRKLHHWTCLTDDAEPCFVLHRCGFDSRGNAK
jgi:hypothetical protein